MGFTITKLNQINIDPENRQFLEEHRIPTLYLTTSMLVGGMVSYFQ